MLVYKKGNILDDDADWVVNPVNCVGIMGKGLALQFKNKYPGYFSEYKEECKRGFISVGDPFFHWQGFGTDSGINVERNIVSFATKKHWKDKSKLEWIKSGLDEMVIGIRQIFDNEYWYKDEFKSIVFPKIGCGLGGLDWETQVKPLIEEFAAKVPEIEVRVYE